MDADTLSAQVRQVRKTVNRFERLHSCAPTHLRGDLNAP
ncbi:MAG: hypothetical protein THHGLFOP_001541, partial [Candidatus Fervidibacter sp.]